ncbi:MAG: type II toxin-antitoxin system VapC family toxin [Acidobacteriota bacterium]
MADFTITDTDILIDAGRGVSDAIICLNHIEQKSYLAASIITQMELLVGCRNKTEVKELERFLSRFKIINITEEISENAVGLLKQYRLSHGLLIPDAMIAATALQHNAEFITKNQRDFRFIKGLKILAYP